MTGPETEFHNWHHIPTLPENGEEFLRGYLEAIAFTDMSQDGDEAFGCEFAPEAIADAKEECELFQKKESLALAEAYRRDYDAYQAGRDFWFTRNGHGVGFWDREAIEGPIADELTEAARSFGGHDVYKGDDGFAYLG